VVNALNSLIELKISVQGVPNKHSFLKASTSIKINNELKNLKFKIKLHKTLLELFFM
jgi:hypothetical protein